MLNTKQAGATRFRDVEIELKAAGEDGIFEGYASVFNVLDSGRDIVLPGAFAASIAERKAKGRKLPILWQHRAGEPLGSYTEVVEDAAGLRVKGKLLVDDVPRAREAYALIKDGAISGLSIGYIIREDAYDQKERVRTLKRLDLAEVSIVTNPMLDIARIDTVKMKIARGEMPSLPEFEQLLREAGFSKSQSAVIANRGLSHLLRSESAASGESHKAVTELAQFLGGFRIN